MIPITIVPNTANVILAAIEAFCHTFESKTNNDWEEINRGVAFVRFSEPVA